MDRTVLTLMAHPDDAEILCGGTLALLARRGWRVHIASASRGDCGSATRGPDEISAIRAREGRDAAAVIGGVYHCLDGRDALIRYDEGILTRACGLYREVRPSIVITHYPSDYMVDHEQISLVARATAFNAPIPNAPASPGTTPLESIPHLYYADPVEGKDSLGEPVRPRLLIDVTTVMETKLRMVSAHASQREWLRSHHGVDEYLDSTKRWGAARGEFVGCDYAEGFRQHLGHAYPQDDLLGSALGEHSHELRIS